MSTDTSEVKAVSQREGDNVGCKAKGCHDPEIKVLIGHRSREIKLLRAATRCEVIHGNDRKEGFIYT